MAMEFEKFLKESVQEVEEELEKILSSFLKEAKSTDTKLLPLALGFLNACKGGKRIRGVLVKLGYEMTRSVIPAKAGIYIDSSVKTENDITKVAAAYEILHSSVLAHDDIIDESLERRGKPSLYKALGGDHYGISQAISLADMGFFMAIKIITESEFADEEKNNALKHLSKVMVDTAIGEMLDLEKGADQLTVIKLKTARYSISGPLVLGAILGGGREGELGRLGKFGENLGIAYQIKDDILDEEFKLGDLQYCQKKVLEYSFEASKMIPEITSNSELRSLLEGMVEYLMKRTK